jgi:hypothetical protein
MRSASARLCRGCLVNPIVVMLQPALGATMKKTSVLLALVSAMFVACMAVPASAQATRTWISGVGDDANPCSRTAPCKTWAGAISKTAAGGEIDGLDPGGFGALTITKSITLDGVASGIASSLVSGTNGMNISAGAGDVVILRNLEFNGLLNNGSPGVTGIQLNSAQTLMIQHCQIFGFSSNGISLQPSTVPSSGTVKVSISDSHIQNVSTTTGTAGILIAPASGVPINVTVDRTHVEGLALTNGIFVNGNAGGNIQANISNSVITGASNAGISVAATSTATANATVTNTVITHGTTGAVVAGGNGTLTVGADTITNNTTGLVNGGGKLQTFMNNMVINNATNVSGSLTTVGFQ